MSAEKPVLGVLGGMGSLAGVEFCKLLIDFGGAESDEDNISFVLWSDPRLPPRPPVVMGKSTDDPGPGMVSIVQQLQETGVGAIAIPCNTAHWWYDMLVDALEIPILHIADAAVDEMTGVVPDGAKVSVFGTPGTLHARIYHERLEARGFEALSPSEETVAHVLEAAIADVKRNDPASGQTKLLQAVEGERQKGAVAVILGCTEMPVAMAGVELPDIQLIDPNAALARACISWWKSYA